MSYYNNLTLLVLFSLLIRSELGVYVFSHYCEALTTVTTGLSILVLFVSTMYPLITISSIMKWAFSMLNIICIATKTVTLLFRKTKSHTYIEFTDVFEVFVEGLNHVMDEL